jgi:hypothetical protein
MWNKCSRSRRKQHVLLAKLSRYQQMWYLVFGETTMSVLYEYVCRAFEVCCRSFVVCHHLHFTSYLNYHITQDLLQHLVKVLQLARLISCHQAERLTLLPDNSQQVIFVHYTLAFLIDCSQNTLMVEVKHTVRVWNWGNLCEIPCSLSNLFGAENDNCRQCVTFT